MFSDGWELAGPVLQQGVQVLRSHPPGVALLFRLMGLMFGLRVRVRVPGVGAEGASRT